METSITSTGTSTITSPQGNEPAAALSESSTPLKNRLRTVEEFVDKLEKAISDRL